MRFGRRRVRRRRLLRDAEPRHARGIKYNREERGVGVCRIRFFGVLFVVYCSVFYRKLQYEEKVLLRYKTCRGPIDVGYSFFSLSLTPALYVSDEND